jgi:mannose-6-phosphate isomerase-like protein (cupin superfamily)
VIGDAPHRRVEILSDHETLHATWSRFGPHTDGADLHVHRHHTDCFYVLEGEAEFVLNDEVVRAGPGSFVAAPIGAVHGFRNAGEGELRLLNIHAPNTGFGVRLRR